MGKVVKVGKVGKVGERWVRGSQRSPGVLAASPESALALSSISDPLFAREVVTFDGDRVEEASSPSPQRAGRPDGPPPEPALSLSKGRQRRRA